MNKIIILLLVGIFLRCSVFQKHHEKYDSSCSIMKSGTFISTNLGDKTNTITIKGDVHIEHDYSKKYETKSQITWLSECSYELKIIETNYVNRPFKVNDKMLVTIEKVEGNYIYFNAQYKDMMIKDTLLKVKN